MEFVPNFKFLVDQDPGSLVLVVCFLLFSVGEQNHQQNVLFH